MTKLSPDLPKIRHPQPKNHELGHPHIDRRVLEMTRLKVARIDCGPTLVRVGLDNIDRWTRRNGGYLP